MRRALLLALTILFALSSAQAQTNPTPVYGYKVIATFPHSTSSYTEGFFYLNGLFYEGTGIKGHSQILVYDPTGHVKQHLDLAPQYFGEGIVNWGPNLYEWTWQAHIGFVYNRATLHPLARFTYTGEGWGMTHDGTHILTDDGTAIIRFRDPKDFHEVRNITVTDQGSPVTNLNELEYIHGEIYANVWHTNRIARISPRDGHVIAWIDLTGLSPRRHAPRRRSRPQRHRLRRPARPPLRHRQRVAHHLPDQAHPSLPPLADLCIDDEGLSHPMSRPLH